MTEVFETKLRKVGNSLGIIIPNEILQLLGYRQGDSIHVALPLSDKKTRNKKLLLLAGIDKSKSEFKRDEKDRY